MLPGPVTSQWENFQVKHELGWNSFPSLRDGKLGIYTTKFPAQKMSSLTKCGPWKPQSFVKGCSTLRCHLL